MATQVITANLLREGEVVYLAEDGRWSLWLDEALLARTPEEAGTLEQRAEEAVSQRQVVGPYLMAVAEEEGRPRALSTREKIRAIVQREQAWIDKK